MSEALLAIAADHCRHACKDAEDLDTRIKLAMEAATDFFMSTDDQVRFQGAVAAIHMESDPETQHRITETVAVLKAMQALTSGVPVDIEAVLERQTAIPGGPLPLIGAWHDAKKAAEQ